MNTAPVESRIRALRAPDMLKMGTRAFAGGVAPIQNAEQGRLAGIDAASFNKLGAAGVQGQQWQNAVGCPMTSIPVIEYVTLTVPLPLTDTQLGATFGPEVQVLNQQGTPSGVASVDSSFAVNGILQANMLTCGVGVHAFGEPLSFSQIGNSILSTSTGLPISPDVFSQNDALHGALGPTAVGSIIPAVMEWGFADWNAIYHLTNAYQFQWTFCQRYLLLNELLADVAFYGPYAEGQGFGTSDVIVQQYIAQMNSYYGPTAGTLFAPVSHRRIGSANANAVATAGPTFGAVGTNSGNIGIFHPVRDFDLAPVSFGGLKTQAGSGGQPFRKMSKPIYLPAGLPIKMTLNVQDSYHFQQMTRYMSISESASGTGTNKLALVSVTPGVAALSGIQNPGSATAGLEITLDQGINQFTQQLVNTDRNLYKGGVMKLAMLIKGFEVGGPWTSVIGNPNLTSQLSSQIYMPGREDGIGLIRQ
jgi:hypothetical protein